MRLGQAALQLSQEFTWDRIAEQTAGYFRELIAIS
jgi:hypothetical protein